MSELIKREDAISRKELLDYINDHREDFSDYSGYSQMFDFVDTMPTVDAVPVVRCGRCEYYSNEMNCCSYVNGLQNVTKTDYCSYGKCADGERR